MKKILAIVVIVFSIISFNMAMKNFDNLVVLNTFDVYGFENNNTATTSEYSTPATLLAINVSYDRYAEFSQYFISLLSKYDLNAYQFSSSDYRNVIFVYSTDPNYISKIKTYHVIDQLTDFHYYTSTSIDNETKILKPLKTSTIEFYSIASNYNDNLFNFSNSTYLSANRGNLADSTNRLVSEIIENYPDVEVRMSNHDMHFTPKTALANDEIALLILVSMLIITLLNTDYLRKIKLITLKTINGFSNLDIFNQYFTKSIITIVLAVIVLYLIQIIYHFGLHFNQVIELLVNLSQYLIILFGLLLIIGIITYITISIVNSNLIIKGYSKLKPQLTYTYMLRILTVFICFSFLSNGAEALITYMESRINEKNYLDQINDVYFLDASSSAINDFQISDEYYMAQNLISEYLVKNNDSFLFSDSGYMQEENIHFYNVSEAYIQKLSIIGEFDEALGVLNIMIPNSYDETTISKIKKYIEGELFFINEKFNYVNYDNSIVNYTLNQTFINNTVNQGVLIKQAGGHGLSSKTFFTYHGDDAKGYINDLFKSYDFLNPFKVTSLLDAYEFYKSFDVYSLINRINYFLLTFIIIIIMSIQNFYLYMICHIKKLALCEIEGWSYREIMTDFINKELAVMILCGIALVAFEKTTIITAFSILLIMFIVNIIFSYVYFKLRFIRLYRRELK
ncbi:MAG: hypothetical protein PHG99_02160 [Erysipelotrichaceae bacterium]|nr:hypothetical protein [Erysipelotrichaceae bacterium]